MSLDLWSGLDQSDNFLLTSELCRAPSTQPLTLKASTSEFALGIDIWFPTQPFTTLKSWIFPFERSHTLWNCRGICFALQKQEKKIINMQWVCSWWKFLLYGCLTNPISAFSKSYHLQLNVCSLSLDPKVALKMNMATELLNSSRKETEHILPQPTFNPSIFWCK